MDQDSRERHAFRHPHAFRAREGRSFGGDASGCGRDRTGQREPLARSDRASAPGPEGSGNRQADRAMQGRYRGGLRLHRRRISADHGAQGNRLRAHLDRGRDLGGCGRYATFRKQFPGSGRHSQLSKSSAADPKSEIPNQTSILQLSGEVALLRKALEDVLKRVPDAARRPVEPPPLAKEPNKVKRGDKPGTPGPAQV